MRQPTTAFHESATPSISTSAIFDCPFCRVNLGRALRKMILRAPVNGLEPALVRLGRRVLIDRERFNEWLSQHQKLSA